MSAFIPTTNGYLRRASEQFTASGLRSYSDPIPVGLSVIKVSQSIDQTSVRADKSGTKSFADESLGQGRALLEIYAVPKPDDLLQIGAVTFEIAGVRPVYDMYGEVDHYQVELSSWA